MAKSLNPQAAENREQDAKPESSPESSSSPSSSDDERRGFLVKLAAGAIGAVLGIFPVAAGALTILDPLIGKKKTKGKKIRVATVDQLPDDGTPVRVPIEPIWLTPGTANRTNQSERRTCERRETTWLHSTRFAHTPAALWGMHRTAMSFSAPATQAHLNWTGRELCRHLALEISTSLWLMRIDLPEPVKSGLTL